MPVKFNTSTIYAADLGHGVEPIRLLEVGRLWTRTEAGQYVPSRRTAQCWETLQHGTVAHLAIHQYGLSAGSPRDPELLASLPLENDEPLSPDPALVAAATDVVLAACGLELTLVHTRRQVVGTWSNYLRTLEASR